MIIIIIIMIIIIIIIETLFRAIRNFSVHMFCYFCIIFDIIIYYYLHASHSIIHTTHTYIKCNATSLLSMLYI